MTTVSNVAITLQKDAEIVAGKAMSHACRFCGKTEGDIPFKQCSGCKAVRYCSKACQADHWKEHKTLCQAISTLADQNYREDRE